MFVAVAESLRAAFNAFELIGNFLAVTLGAFLEGLGSWVSSDLEQFGKDLKQNAMKAADQNFEQMKDAGSNAVAAGGRAIFGSDDAGPGAEAGPLQSALRKGRAANTPEARAQRDAERKQRDADRRAAIDAKAATDRAAREAKIAEEKAKKIAPLQDKEMEKAGEAAEITAERQKALGTKSNEALQANDVRSGEGIAQFMALASGREDPAIAEYRKQTQKLEELKAEIRQLQTQQVEILGAAA